MSNVIPIPERGTRAVITNALSAKLSGVIVIGWTQDGGFWTDAHVKDGGDALWLVEMAKKKILEGT